MKILKTVPAAMVLAFCLVTAATAADIMITVDSTDKTMTLTSMLGSPVHVMGLVSPSGYYGTSIELPAQGSAVAPLIGDLPADIESARCNAGEEELPGFTKTPEGFYLIPVEVQ